MSLLSQAGAPSVDMNYFLERKYAQLQQQADATTSNAASTAIQANANANASAAAANLDTTRAKLLPAESAASIGLQGAQANLIGQQASVVRPVALANIASTQAGTAGQLLQNRDFTRTHLTGIFGGTPGIPTLDSMTAAGTAAPVTGPVTVRTATDQLPSLSTPTSLPTDRQPGESYTAWSNRIAAMQQRGFR